MASVMELVDMPDCESGPCGFEPRHSPSLDSSLICDLINGRMGKLVNPQL